MNDYNHRVRCTKQPKLSCVEELNAYKFNKSYAMIKKIDRRFNHDLQKFQHAPTFMFLSFFFFFFGLERLILT